MTTQVCPNPETLEKLLLGDLPKARREDLAEHVLQCEKCAALADTLTICDDLIAAIQARRAINGDEESLAEAIQRAKQLRYRAETVAVDETVIADGPPRGEDPSAESIPGRTTTLVEEIDFLAPAQESGEIGRLGGYRVLEVIGAGGMGVVFRAEDPKLKRQVALKAMKPSIAASHSAKERFLKEAEATAAIEHDHIVTIFQVGEDRGIPFIAMRYLRGESLRTRLESEKQLDQREVVRLGRQMALGLAAAHERGLIHRDIKPDNIWLDSQQDRVKIVDFGLARSIREDAGLTRSGVVVGTPTYMAPEQAEGQDVDHRCDLFSLGSVLYHLVSGRPPFDRGNLTATLLAVARHDPQPIETFCPEIDPRLSALVMKLLSKDREERPRTASEVATTLTTIEKQLADSAAAGREVDLAKTAIVSRSPTLVTKTSTRKRKLIAAAVVAALSVVLLGLWMAQLVFTVGTEDGTLHVKVTGDDFATTVQGRKVIVKNTETDETYEILLNSPQPKKSLQPGVYLVLETASDSGLSVAPTNFTIRSGKDELIEVRWEPSQVASGTAPAPPLPPGVTEVVDLMPFVRKYTDQTDDPHTRWVGEAIEIDSRELPDPRIYIPLTPVKSRDFIIRGQVRLLETIEPGGKAMVGFRIPGSDMTRIGSQSNLSAALAEYETAVVELHETRITPSGGELRTLALRPHPVGEFVELQIAAVGDTLTVDVDGLHWIQCPAPWTTHGYTALAAISARVQFRGMQLLLLDSSDAQPSELLLPDVTETVDLMPLARQYTERVEDDRNRWVGDAIELDSRANPADHAFVILQHVESRDFIIEGQVRLIETVKDGGWAGVGFRSQGECVTLYTSLNQYGETWLEFFELTNPPTGCAVRTLTKAPLDVPLDEFVDLRVSAIGHTLTAHVNGELLAQCEAPWTTPGTAFLVSDSGKSRFRNMRLMLLEPADSSGDSVSADDDSDWPDWPADAPPPTISPFDPAQAKRHQRAWADFLDVPVEREIDLGGGQTLTMVLIPPGEFLMGSTENEMDRFFREAVHDNAVWAYGWFSSEAPQHPVRLTRPFWLSRDEVTRGQFRQFVETGYQTEGERRGEGGWGDLNGEYGRHATFLWSGNPAFPQTEDHPVVNVSWNDTRAFCEWLSQTQSPLRFVFPTEAQWEFACRAGSTTSWYGSDHERDLQVHAWLTRDGTHPVGQRLPNPFGLHDLHGNAWEWCADWFSRDYYSQSPTNDPAGPPTGVYRIHRGGSWDNSPWGGRSAFRVGRKPDFAHYSVGFRVAATVDLPLEKRLTDPSKGE